MADTPRSTDGPTYRCCGWSLHVGHAPDCTGTYLPKPLSTMRRVIIESPYAGDIERNVIYARRALLDSTSRDESPLASHLLYTQILDDSILTDRTIGIRAGHSWFCVAQAIIFYLDYDYSPGMQAALDAAKALYVPIESRWIGKNP